jgi:hypothetical protein
MYDLLNAVYSMKMDIYRQEEAQDPDTGSIRKSWSYYKTVPCHAKGVISNSATSRTGDYQVLKDKYINAQIIVVRTESRLTLREKVTNVCSSDGTVIWTEIDYPSETPTVFEVIGSTPLTDPFGSVLGYNSTLKRSENQTIGI